MQRISSSTAPMQANTSWMIAITRAIVKPADAVPGSMFLLAAANISQIPATITIAGSMLTSIENTDIPLNMPETARTAL